MLNKEPHTTEQFKKIFQQNENLIIAKGLTRADMAFLIVKVESLMKYKDTSKNQTFEEQWVEVQYEMHDKKFYNEMKDNILQNFDVEQIKQCFFAFECQQYYICVCGLLPLMERIIVSDKKDVKYDWNQLEDDFKKRYHSYFNNDTENNLKEYVVRLILRKLAGFEKFDQKEPDYLNRHWILHGRTDRLPTKADCLRLFNIIELILDIKSEAA